MNASPRIVYLTAGAAGMYCGSCMHDNTLARALLGLGIDIQLLPLYTPIRTDEEDVSQSRVFFGGINVYLQQKFAVFRRMPQLLDRLLDQPWLLRWIASGRVETSAGELGDLTVSVLKGSDGHQRKEVHRLCEWLASSGRPHLVVLSNVLIAGCVPELKRILGVPVLVTLQGDDIFLEELVEPYRSQALAQIRRLAESIDGFVCHSRYYADYMSEYLQIPRERFHQVPLGVDTRDFQNLARRETLVPTVGYLARLTPEKGLHVLVEAFLRLREMEGTEQARLEIAGWLGSRHQAYAEREFERLRAAGVGDSFRYWGTVSRAEKLQMLSQLDVLSVPTLYRDPKGLFILEALAAGVPVVQPAHGAFPELLEHTGGGRLVPPGDPLALAHALHEVLLDTTIRQELARQGRQQVAQRFSAEATARATWEVWQQFLPPPDAAAPAAGATLARGESAKK